MFKIPLFVVSDGTGETVEEIVKAVSLQYPNSFVDVLRYKTVRSVEQVEKILDEAQQRSASIIFTAVKPDVREALKKGAQERSLNVIDLLGPILDLFTSLTDRLPQEQPGLLHKIDEKYYRRIEAIEFTVKQDDGACPENLSRADIVLVGVSRTSKTPLSIFLSHKGYKVANVPLVMGIDPPPQLFDIEQSKIIGLIIEPDALVRIRRERLLRMGREPTGEYASLAHISEEIEWSRNIFSRNKLWPIFDVTNKALEETASEILRLMKQRESLKRKLNRISKK